MKIIKILLVVFIFLLSSCNKKEMINQNENFDYINDMNLENMTYSSYQHVAPSENGIYYTMGNYIYFYDFASQQHVLLCNKPNCKHNLESEQLIAQECNAYIKNASYGGIIDSTPIIYNNKKLYMHQITVNFQNGLTNGYDILEINQDGSDRKILAHVEEMSHINNFCVHQNRLYYKVDNNAIYSLELNSENTEPKELFANQLDGIYVMFCKDNYLYLSCGTYIDEDNVEHYGVYGKVDLKTNEFEIIKENEGDTYFNLLDDNSIIFTRNYDTYVYLIDEKEEIKLSDDSGIVHVTKDYIYVVNGINDHIEGSNSISVYDKQFNFIDSIVLEEGMKHCTAGAYNNQVFVLYQDPNSKIERLYNIYVNNDKLELSEFCEVDTSISAAGYQFNVNDYK